MKLAPIVADAAVSEAKSSKSNSQSRVSHGAVFWHGARETLTIREVSGKPMEFLILNEYFIDFITYEKSQAHERFDRFTKKVRGLTCLYEY